MVVQVEASAENAFPVHKDLTWYNCEVGVEHGWTLEDGKLVSPEDQSTIAAGDIINVGE